MKKKEIFFGKKINEYFNFIIIFIYNFFFVILLFIAAQTFSIKFYILF